MQNEYGLLLEQGGQADTFSSERDNAAVTFLRQYAIPIVSGMQMSFEIPRFARTVDN